MGRFFVGDQGTMDFEESFGGFHEVIACAEYLLSLDYEIQRHHQHRCGA